MLRIPAGFVMATHAEVMMTSEGSRLFVPGAFTSGSFTMISGSLATGENQVGRTVKHRQDGHFCDAGILGEIEAMAP